MKPVEYGPQTLRKIWAFIPCTESDSLCVRHDSICSELEWNQFVEGYSRSAEGIYIRFVSPVTQLAITLYFYPKETLSYTWDDIRRDLYYDDEYVSGVCVYHRDRAKEREEQLLNEK